jgi:hypothetical protein
MKKYTGAEVAKCAWGLFTGVSVGCAVGYILYVGVVLTLAYTGIEVFGYVASPQACAMVYVEGRGEVKMCEGGWR